MKIKDQTYTRSRQFTFGKDPDSFTLESGRKLSQPTLTYETYGQLNRDRSNAILVCHALSGDAHAAGWNEYTDQSGWWDAMIGPGRALDTNRYFILCSNVLGGCKGSTGPSSINPQTGVAYALDFPFITIGDIVNAQRHLVDHLGIDRLLSVIGGSMGGMQALQWLAAYPNRVRSAIPIATALKHSPQQIAFNEVVRQSIMGDPSWKKGNYYDFGQPKNGLSIARMIGHITFMSDASMEEKFSRKLKNGKFSFSFDEDFEVEGYLRYRGKNFVKRFDANSYLYITKAMDYFDLSANNFHTNGSSGDVRCLVISFTSDWLYPSTQSQDIVRILKKHRFFATYCELSSKWGHDAFLVEVKEQTRLISNFLRSLAPEITTHNSIPENIPHRIVSPVDK